MRLRPTTLTLVERHCPHALVLSAEGAPYDRTVYATGTAAHEYLEAAANGVPLESITERLLTSGRSGEDAEGPLPADAVLRGLDLARDWIRRHGTPTGDAERRYSLGADGDTTTDHEAAVLSTRLDLVYWTEEETDEGLSDVVVARDYKSSWRADASELDTLQRRIQAAMLWTHHTEAAGVRVEVANLRSGAIYSRTLWRGVDDDLVCRWILDALDATSALQDPGRLAPSPGARCIGCPYASGACSHVHALAGDEHADPVRRWTAARAMVDALEPLARRATDEDPVDIDGHLVGWQATERRTLATDAAPTLLSAYEATAGEVPEEWRDWAIGLVSSLASGVSSVTQLGKALYRGRGSKEARTVLADSVLVSVPSRRWGVR